MPEVLQGSLDPAIAPRRILSRRRHLTQDLAAEPVAIHREASSLGIRQPHAPPVQLLAQDAGFFPQVRDNLQLVAIHPTREGHEQDPQADGIDHGGESTRRLPPSNLTNCGLG